MPASTSRLKRSGLCEALVCLPVWIGAPTVLPLVAYFPGSTFAFAWSTQNQPRIALKGDRQVTTGDDPLSWTRSILQRRRYGSCPNTERPTHRNFGNRSLIRYVSGSASKNWSRSLARARRPGSDSKRFRLLSRNCRNCVLAVTLTIAHKTKGLTWPIEVRPGLRVLDAEDGHAVHPGHHSMRNIKNSAHYNERVPAEIPHNVPI